MVLSVVDEQCSRGVTGRTEKNMKIKCRYHLGKDGVHPHVHVAFVTVLLLLSFAFLALACFPAKVSHAWRQPER